MAVPSFQDFFRPVLRLVAEGASSPRECLPGLQDHFSLTQEDMADQIPSGVRSRVHDRADWSIFHMRKAGLIRRVKRGVYEVTEEGRSVLEDGPEHLDLAYLRTLEPYRAWREEQSGTDEQQETSHQSSSAETPEERIAAAVSEIESNLAGDLRERLRGNTPDFFEKAVLDLLVAMGYGRGRKASALRTGQSGDGGIDGIINEDALGLDRVYVQAKRYAEDNSIAPEQVRGFVGAMTGEQASKGVFVTTSRFSSSALDFAQKVSQRVILIDGPEFARLMVKYGVGVRSERRVDVHVIDENFFSEG